MSMLSIQIGKLRETADKLEKIAAANTPWAYNSLTPMLREAADTIESLRDRAQTAIELERENERLRRAGYEVGYHDAMAALGNGECELVDNGPWGYPYTCSACCAQYDTDILNGDLNHCPNCGKAVKR